MGVTLWGAAKRKTPVRTEPYPRASPCRPYGTRLSRRDGTIVAWYEVPGTAPSQKSRPVGYGLIHAGERTIR